MSKRKRHTAEQIVKKLRDADAMLAAGKTANEGWADTMAAYRFIDKQAVEPDKILEPHIEATKQRMPVQPVVLVLQDTTEFFALDECGRCRRVE